ncbi:Selenocysteine methyltransferase [Balamuthia mandrillaris]
MERKSESEKCNVRFPLERLLAVQGFAVVDGGLATELERMGLDLKDRLWSARLLVEDPDKIKKVHKNYLEAGADIIITSSYQATFQGFAQRGLSHSESQRLFALSISLAKEARDAYWGEVAGEKKNKGELIKPLIAASVGPYGAHLNDGSEYDGRYGLTPSSLESLIDFHRERLQLLLSLRPDLVACETIPCGAEAKALLRLMDELQPTEEGEGERNAQHIQAWFSYSCKDEKHLNSGERIADCVRELLEEEAKSGRRKLVAAIGVNCTSPAFISGLLQNLMTALREAGRDIPLIVYPNSGEGWDAHSKEWTAPAETFSLESMVAQWRQEGASLIGGCCRTTPGTVTPSSCFLFFFFFFFFFMYVCIQIDSSYSAQSTLAP